MTPFICAECQSGTVLHGTRSCCGIRYVERSTLDRGGFQWLREAPDSPPTSLSGEPVMIVNSHDSVVPLAIVLAGPC